MALKEIITVGMPVKNGAKYLAKSLDCILAQTNVTIRILASDNCSNDETSLILDNYSMVDERITIYTQKTPLTAIENFKFVLDQTDTEFFCWAAADDFRHPDFLHLLLLNIGSKGGAFARYCYFDLLNNEILQEPILPKLNSFATNKEQLRAYLAEHRAPNMIYGLFRTNAIRRVFNDLMAMGSYDMMDIIIVSKLISKYGINTIHNCPIMFYAGQEGSRYQHKPVKGSKIDTSRYDAEILIICAQNMLIKELTHNIKKILLDNTLLKVMGQLIRIIALTILNKYHFTR